MTLLSFYTVEFDSTQQEDWQIVVYSPRTLHHLASLIVSSNIYETESAKKVANKYIFPEWRRDIFWRCFDPYTNLWREIEAWVIRKAQELCGRPDQIRTINLNTRCRHHPGFWEDHRQYKCFMTVGKSLFSIWFYVNQCAVFGTFKKVIGNFNSQFQFDLPE
jgi:hypothetical protein